MSTHKARLLAAVSVAVAIVAFIWIWNGYHFAPAIHTDSAVVWAPHPDDETYAMGATIADLTSRGTSVTVVLLTDGEGSSYSQWWIDEHGVDLDGDLDIDKWDFALARRIEFRNAARALGVDRLVFLGSADTQGQTGLLEGATADQFEAAIELAISRYHLAPQTHMTVAAYTQGDPRASDEREHRDHASTYAAVRSLAQEQATEFMALKVYEYEKPVWQRMGIRTVVYAGRPFAAKRAALDAYSTIGRESTSDLWSAAHTEFREFVSESRP